MERIFVRFLACKYNIAHNFMSTLWADEKKNRFEARATRHTRTEKIEMRLVRPNEMEKTKE